MALRMPWWSLQQGYAVTAQLAELSGTPNGVFAALNGNRDLECAICVPEIFGNGLPQSVGSKVQAVHLGSIWQHGVLCIFPHDLSGLVPVSVIQMRDVSKDSRWQSHGALLRYVCVMLFLSAYFVLVSVLFLLFLSCSQLSCSCMLHS